jgi:hypothetical protein
MPLSRKRPHRLFTGVEDFDNPMDTQKFKQRQNRFVNPA